MLLLALGLAAPAGSEADPTDADAELAARLSKALRGGALRRARIGALVVRASDGAVLFEHGADRPLTPASNVKILTAMAALKHFGPTHRFETQVLSPAPPDAEGAVDSLVVRGGGDPAINSEDWWRLASELRRSGLRRVRGDVWLDDRAFDRVRWHPSWGATSARAYHAPVGALTANYGAFAVTVTPGAQRGDAVDVVIEPPVSYLRVSNQARTTAETARSTLVVDRVAAGATERVMIKGSLPAGGKPRTFYRSVMDPTRYAGSVLTLQLAAVGIAVDGVALPGAREGAEHELLRFEGRPLAEIVRLFVKYSNNAVAESLVKAMGAGEGSAGSWRLGSPVLRRTLLGLGLDGESFSLVDGSGLSYENKISPRLLVEALRIARSDFSYGPELVAALPIAAGDGTLEKRAEGSRGGVRAKTGLLNSVTGLSGFAERPDRSWAVFSILVNGYRAPDDEVMKAVDGFVHELVRDPSAVGRTREAPAPAQERAPPRTGRAS